MGTEAAEGEHRILGDQTRVTKRGVARRTVLGCGGRLPCAARPDPVISSEV